MHLSGSLWQGGEYMKTFKKLPDAEFTIMKSIWQQHPPVSTAQIIDRLDASNQWKPQTVLTLLVRLINKGFLSSEKKGRERIYSPLISEEEYLEYETGNFMEQYHQNSLVGLVNTLYKGKSLSSDDIEELRNWLDEKE